MSRLAAAALPSLAEYHSQHLAHIFWSFGSLGIINRSLLDALAYWASSRIETFNSQELANTSWACAKLAYLNESLFNSIASMCRAEQIERIERIGLRFVPQDLANIAWAFAKAIYVKVPVLVALCSRAAGCIQEFNHQDLANMAWAMANLLLRNEKLMRAIAEHAEERISQFEGTDFSSTAWSLATLHFEHEALRRALAEQVRSKIWSLGSQQLGSLADLKLGCQDVVEAKLRDIVRHFARAMPRSLEDFQRKYSKMVQEVEADTFGTWGDELLLDLLGLTAAPDFKQKAAGLALKYHQQNLHKCFRGENLLHQRVVSYAELDLSIQQQVLQYASYQQNGYDDWRPKKDFLYATCLPCNALVDRSLCSEFQLLSKICEEVASFLSQVQRAPWFDVRGQVQIFVAGAPCLSCVGAIGNSACSCQMLTSSLPLGQR